MSMSNKITELISPLKELKDNFSPNILVFLNNEEEVLTIAAELRKK